MKTLKVSNFAMVALSLTIFCSGATINAQTPNAARNQSIGGVGTGGGDACENRIQEIQKDIVSWINRKGHEGLELPDNFESERYAKDMKNSIRNAVIECVKPGDKSYPVEVDGVSKTCKFDKDGITTIRCDFDTFMNKTNSERQYFLIHHEHAGAIGVEPPKGPDSNYTISKQITEFLEEQKVLRLAVKRVPKTAVRMFEVTAYEALFTEPGTGRLVYRFREGKIFKGTIHRNLNASGVDYVRIEQLFDGIDWEPVEQALVEKSHVRALERRMIKIHTLTPLLFSYYKSAAILEKLDGGTRLRGWIVESNSGADKFLFAEEVFENGRWQKMEQPGYIYLNGEN